MVIVPLPLPSDAPTPPYWIRWIFAVSAGRGEPEHHDHDWFQIVEPVRDKLPGRCRRHRLPSSTPTCADCKEIMRASRKRTRAALYAKDTDGNYLAVCRAPEAAENGLRLDALGNLI